MPRALLPFCIPLLVGSASAAERTQSPDVSWRTIPTAHYRVHHPDRPEFQGFAREVASKIEGIHSLLEKEVGHAFKGPTDVIVQNPEAVANGMVASVKWRPVVILWTQPIESDSEISHSGNWVDLLLLHELVHLHHLTLPDRQPSPMDRLTRPHVTRMNRCPGWVVEGYATYLEGRLTGIGRPHSATRATVLRQLAREGQLPTYKGLSGVNWNLGSGIRYQAGSAFMEWLLEKHSKGHGVWPELWKRISSKRYGSFGSAFKATFGETPEALYGRYQAELTHTALETERRLSAAGLREGEVWSQAASGLLGNLAVSPDGSCLLAQASTPEATRAGLQVFLLADDGKKTQKEKAAKEKAKAKDKDMPEDVKELRPTRTPEHTLATDGPSRPFQPLWKADGTIEYRVFRRDAESVSFRTTGTWKPRSLKATTPSIQHAYPVWQRSGWEVSLGGTSVKLPFAPYGAVAHDTLRKVVYAATPVDGVFNLVRLPFDGATFGPMEPLTRTAAGALYPAPTPDGRALYYVQPSGLGSQIRKLDLSLPPLPPLPQSVVAAVTDPFVKDTVISRPDGPSLVPAPVEPPADQAYRVSESHVASGRYGLVFDPSNAALQVGLGGNDILGRLNWTALASVPLPGSHARGPRGFTAGAAWRGWAWAPSLQAFSSLTRPSQQRFAPVQGWDLERKGAQLALTREWWPSSLEGSAVFSTAREAIAPLALGAKTADRSVLGLEVRQRLAWNRHLARFSATLGGIAQSGRTDNHNWQLQKAAVSLQGGWNDQNLVFQYHTGKVTGSPTAFDRFQLGGQETGLLPQSLGANQIFQPALPSLSASGNRFERWRASMDGVIWVEGTRLWNAGDAKPSYLRVVGIDFIETVSQLVPWARNANQIYLGNYQIRLTLQTPLDGPHKHRIIPTVAITHRF